MPIDTRTSELVKRFEHTGEDWSGLIAAEHWLRFNGYSFGSMQRGEPIGVVKGKCVISKWHSMTKREHRQLDGTIKAAGDGFRDSAAVVTIFRQLGP